MRKDIIGRIIGSLVILLGFALGTMVAAFSIDNWPTKTYKSWVGEVATRTDSEMIMQSSLCVFGLIMAVIVVLVFIKGVVDMMKP